MLKNGLQFWEQMRAAVLAQTDGDPQERKVALAVADERIAFYKKAANTVVPLRPARAQSKGDVLKRQARLRDRALAKYEAYRQARGFTGPRYTDLAVMSTMAHGGSVSIGAPMSEEMRAAHSEAMTERNSLLGKCLATMRRMIGKHA